MEDGTKSVFVSFPCLLEVSFPCLPEDSERVEKNALFGIYSTRNKFFPIARHTLATGLQKYL